MPVSDGGTDTDSISLPFCQSWYGWNIKIDQNIQLPKYHSNFNFIYLTNL